MHTHAHGTAAQWLIQPLFSYFPLLQCASAVRCAIRRPLLFQRERLLGTRPLSWPETRDRGEREGEGKKEKAPVPLCCCSQWLGSPLVAALFVLHLTLPASLPRRTTVEREVVRSSPLTHPVVVLLCYHHTAYIGHSRSRRHPAWPPAVSHFGHPRCASRERVVVGE